MAKNESGLTSTKLFPVVGVAVAAAAVAGYAIMATAPEEDVVADEGAVIEDVPNGALADDDAATNIGTDGLSPTDLEAIHDDVVVVDDTLPPEDTIAPVPADADLTPTEVPPAEVQEPLDAEAAIEEASDSDVVGQEAPAPSRTYVESSGNAVTPEDTDQVTVPTTEVAPEAALIDETEVPPDPDDPVRIDTDMEIDLVVDPDAGMKGGPDPDGGAAPFYPKPSGPEGTDGNAFTTE